MNAPLERQREFAAALTGSLYTIAEKVIGDAIPAEGRVQVYANHFRVSLLEALAATFPVTRALVGEAFFAQTARAFLIFEPPRSPILAQYGGGFPTFLAALPDLGGHSYLPDVAAFEWALNAAYHAEDAPMLMPEHLAEPERVMQMPLPLHPSVQRLSTPFPISEIWQVHQPDAPAVDRIQLAGGAERLLTWRQGIDVLAQADAGRRPAACRDCRQCAAGRRGTGSQRRGWFRFCRQFHLDAGWRPVRADNSGSAAVTGRTNDGGCQE